MTDSESRVFAATSRELNVLIENSQHGLTLLAPDHEVVVTREEHHQRALAPWAPRGDGRPRRVAVELRFARIAHGSHAGKRGIEILLEGQRVGELTLRMTERYAPHVEQVQRSGGRAGCVAMVIHGRRGVEVELRLPDAAAAPAPIPRPLPHPGPPTRPVPNGPGAGGPGPGGGPAPRRSRTPLWVGVGVATALLVIGMNIGGNDDPDVSASANSSSGRSSSAATPTTTVAPAPTSPVLPEPSAVSDPMVVPAAVPDAAVTRAAPRTVPPRTAPPRTAPPRTAPPRTAPSRPAPAVAPEPEPAPVPPPAPAPKPKSGSGCDPNYGGCVPIDSDVDCQGGSGDGPSYVRGPVDVIGDDIYGLDRDKDGTGCDS